MNSWHSWSSDGKWLVFSSKAHSDYTQLYLTRINEKGETSPAVWLAHLVSEGMAANIPEFVPLKPDAIVRIREQFLDDYSYTRAGNELFRAGEPDAAMEKYRMALSLNPDNATAHQSMGSLLYRAKHNPTEALGHLQKAVQLEPENGFAQFDLGMVLAVKGDLTNAEIHLEKAIQILPNGYNRIYNSVDMNYALGETRYRLGHYADCIYPLNKVITIGTNHARGNFLMAMSRAWIGETDTAIPFFAEAVKRDERMAQLPDFYDLLSRNYISKAQFKEGLEAAEKGESLAKHAGRMEQAAKLQERVILCKARQ
jgi:tetratricopeptide (TPR) repeat protein